jgi:hypothetical protein
MKHRLNTDSEKTMNRTKRMLAARERIEHKVGDVPLAGHQWAATGFYRIRSILCRIRVGIYRLATGYYRIAAGFYRVLPPITASYRIKFIAAPQPAQPVLTRFNPHEFFGGSSSAQKLWRAGKRGRLGNGVLEFWGGRLQEAARTEAALLCAMGTKLCGKITGFIASFHALSDIIAQNRPVLSHFLAFYRSEPFLRKRHGLGTYSRQDPPQWGCYAA